MPGQWIVLVEATDVGASGGVDREDVLRLLAAMDHDRVGGLHSPDRYALQVTTTAGGPAEALSSVVASWTNAVLELGLPAWEMVRAEVLTPGELERDQWNHLRNETSTLCSGDDARARPRRCRLRRASPPPSF